MPSAVVRQIARALRRDMQEEARLRIGVSAWLSRVDEGAVHLINIERGLREGLQRVDGAVGRAERIGAQREGHAPRVALFRGALPGSDCGDGVGGQRKDRRAGAVEKPADPVEVIVRALEAMASPVLRQVAHALGERVKVKRALRFVWVARFLDVDEFIVRQVDVIRGARQRARVLRRSARHLPRVVVVQKKRRPFEVESGDGVGGHRKERDARAVEQRAVSGQPEAEGFESFSRPLVGQGLRLDGSYPQDGNRFGEKRRRAGLLDNGKPAVRLVDVESALDQRLAPLRISVSGLQVALALD